MQVLIVHLVVVVIFVVVVVVSAVFVMRTRPYLARFAAISVRVSMAVSLSV